MQGINHILIKPSKFFWLPNLSLDSLMPNKNNIMKKFFNKVLRKFSSFLDITGYAIILIIINLKTLSKFRNNYGSFGTCRNEKKKRIINVGNVSSIFLGDIIEIIRGLKERPKRILLAGDNNGCKKPFKKALNLDSSEIVTAGLLKPNDFLWNFEHDTPKMGKFDLILSQAMLEHLVNPYKHVEELSKLLVKGGHLVVHTVMPGYDYHPCPVDTLRYYPDWFEEVAIRLKLKIEKKDIRNSHIFYVFEK